MTRANIDPATAERSVGKRVLLVTYHFPPSRAAGAVRWGSFSSTAASLGWAFDVITHVPNTGTSDASQPHQSTSGGAVRVFNAENPTHWFLAASQRLAGIARRLRRSRTSAQAPVAASVEIAPQALTLSALPPLFSRAGLRQAINVLLRHLIFLPWSDRATTLGRALTAERHYDLVISSGPPHLAAHAARRIATRAGIPLVLDFRDPWSTMDVLDPHSASVVYPRLARHYEQRCVDASALVIANTPRAAAAILARYREAEVITIPNGYDGTVPPSTNDSSKFVAIYAGAIYLDRDPRPVFRALASCRSALGLSPENFVFRLIGECEQFGGVPLIDIARSFGVDDLVETVPSMPRDQLYRELAGAALLVNLPQGAKLCVPSKLYEYAQFRAWILAIEPPATATRDLLDPLGADVVTDDTSAIAAVFERRIVQFRSGMRAEPLSAQRDFGFAALADQLMAALDRLPAPTA